MLTLPNQSSQTQLAFLLNNTFSKLTNSLYNQLMAATSSEIEADQERSGRNSQWCCFSEAVRVDEICSGGESGKLTAPYYVIPTANLRT